MTSTLNWKTLLLLLIFLKSNVLSSGYWNLASPCQPFITNFSMVQAEMVHCAINNSIPPSVCLNCYNEYRALKRMEIEMHNLNVTAFNTTCSNVIYNNYVLSYSKDVVDFLTVKIWEQSRCESCFNVSAFMEGNGSTIQWNDHTLKISDLMYKWQDCIEKQKMDVFDPNSTYCANCKTEFNAMFNYYWDIYIEPDIDFCVDIETWMNDTIHLWNNIWNCSGNNDQKRETSLVVYTSISLGILTFLFYGASFAQGERESRRLVQYSRLDPPQGQRSRLLSSASSSNLQVAPHLYNF